MSKLPRNKKFLELEGVRVYLNKKDNSVQIISTDVDLSGREFQLNLNSGTPSEQSLRAILLKNGVITENEAYPGSSIPTDALYPAKYARKWNVFPVGVTHGSEAVTVDVTLEPHILVTGHPAGGKSVVQRNFLIHALSCVDEWKVFGIDLRKVELKYLQVFPDDVVKVGITLEEAVDILREVDNIIVSRYRAMETMVVNNFEDFLTSINYSRRSLTKFPAIMLLVEEISMLLTLEAGVDEKTVEQNILRQEAKGLLESILKRGRAARVHVVAAAQRVDENLFSEEALNRLEFRIVAGPVVSSSVRKTLSIDKSIASSVSANVRGRGVAVSRYFEGKNSSFNSTLFQMYYSTQSMVDDLAKKFKHM